MSASRMKPDGSGFVVRGVVVSYDLDLAACLVHCAWVAEGRRSRRVSDLVGVWARAERVAVLGFGGGSTLSSLPGPGRQGNPAGDPIRALRRGLQGVR